jgi:DNA-binding transcriptional LysR family regulator
VVPDIALDLRYLRYALLAAEHGSFRRTAEILSVSQSTVSRRIQILERRVGIALFERHSSGARATLAGERFLKEAAVGAKHLHQAVDALAHSKRGSTGVLRVGLTACLASSFLTDLLARFHRRFPAVQVSFEEGTSEANTAALLNGRLDVAFMLASSPISGCQSEQLWEENTYIVIPISHGVTSLSEVTWPELSQETFLVMAGAAGPQMKDYIVRQLSALSIRASISVQHVGFENLLNMVAQGFGITVATGSAQSIANPGVRFIPINGGQEAFSFSAVWSAANQNPALKLLIDLSAERRVEARR